MKGYKFIRREAVCAAFVFAVDEETAAALLDVDLQAHGDPIWHRSNTDVIEVDVGNPEIEPRVALVVTTHYARNDQ